MIEVSSKSIRRDVLSPFPSYHSPCLFPTQAPDPKGRLTKRYRDADVMPLQRPSQVPGAPRAIPQARGLTFETFETLDAIAHGVSDLDPPKRSTKLVMRCSRLSR